MDGHASVGVFVRVSLPINRDSFTKSTIPIPINTTLDPLSAQAVADVRRSMEREAIVN